MSRSSNSRIFRASKRCKSYFVYCWQKCERAKTGEVIVASRFLSSRFRKRSILFIISSLIYPFFLFTMNRDFIMNSNASSPSSQRRLIDYTKEKNPNMACNRGIADGLSPNTIFLPATNNRQRIKPSYENTIAHHDPKSLSIETPQIGKITSNSSTDMDGVVDFFLKIPPRERRRARSIGSSSEVSRKELFLTMLNKRPSCQRSTSDQTLRSPIQKSKRRLSLVSNILRRESNNEKSSYFST